MSYKCFDVSVENHIAHIVMNRPDEFNSMVPEFWRELPEIIAGINEAGEARVIVISSTGKHFCAGMDLAVFGGGDGAGQTDKNAVGQSKESFRHHILHLQDTFNCLVNARIPVLVAIQGGCIGGGVDYSSACDMRYATRDAFFCIQEINIGMTADVGTFPRLCNLIPDGVVREMAYTGRRMYADRAKEVGLVNEVFDTQEEMLAAVMEIAREITQKSPLAVTGSKVMMNYAKDHTEADALDYIAVWQTGMFQPSEMAEAFTAKAEKREPNFQSLKPLRKGM